jgi:hypothetical protein
MDDATSEIYSAFLVEEEGTSSTLQALLEVFGSHGLPSSLYTDRGSHYFYTPKAGEAVDRQRLTHVGQALKRLSIEHIAAYSPQARGRSERMFGTLQDRLIKELAKAGLRDIETANRWIKQVYLPTHNARFARPAELDESGFVKVADAVSLIEALSIQEERVVDRVNTVSWGRLRLQLPQSPLRAHYVKARVRVHQYGDGALAVFHGPRCIARFAADGQPAPLRPTRASTTSCSPPSRTLSAACGGGLRPSLTAAARDVPRQPQVGTKKRPPGRTKKLALASSSLLHSHAPWIGAHTHQAGASTASVSARSTQEADN